MNVCCFFLLICVCGSCAAVLNDRRNKEEQFVTRTSSVSSAYRLKVRSMAVGQSDCFDGRPAADGAGAVVDVADQATIDAVPVSRRH